MQNSIMEVRAYAFSRLDEEAIYVGVRLPGQHITFYGYDRAYAYYLSSQRVVDRETTPPQSSDMSWLTARRNLWPDRNDREMKPIPLNEVPAQMVLDAMLSASRYQVAYIRGNTTKVLQYAMIQMRDAKVTDYPISYEGTRWIIQTDAFLLYFTSFGDEKGRTSLYADEKMVENIISIFTSTDELQKFKDYCELCGYVIYEDQRIDHKYVVSSVCIETVEDYNAVKAFV